MKKNYIKPNTNTITVKVQSLLQSASQNMGGSKGFFDSSSMSQASRDGGSWDDED